MESDKIEQMNKNYEMSQTHGGTEVTDGSRKLTVEFEMSEGIEGFCLTPCPHSKDCKVNSVTCEKCEHYFGKIENVNIIKCTGARVKNATV